MTYYRGFIGKVQWTDGTNYSSIGAVERFTTNWRIRRTNTDGIATRRRRGSLDTETVPTFNLRYVPRDFNLLTNHLIQSEEGNLSKFSLRFFDGVDYGEIYNIAADTVEVATRHGGPITVDVTGVAENMSDGLPTISWADDSANPPMTWRQTNEMGVANMAMLEEFTAWSFRINNNVIADVTGNAAKPAEVLWGKADYSGRVEYLMKSDFTGVRTRIDQTQKTMIYSFKSRAASPVTKTFTFLKTDWTQNEVELPMDLVVGRVDWESNQLNISTG